MSVLKIVETSLLAICTLILTGCPRSVELNLHNATTSTISVSVNGKQELIASNHEISIQQQNNSHGFERDAQGFELLYVIKGPEKFCFRVNFSGVPDRYLGPGTNRDSRLVFVESGEMYVAPFDSPLAHPSAKTMSMLKREPSLPRCQKPA